MFLENARNFILDLLFPKFCLNCSREGEYLCLDCFSLIDILEVQYCPFCTAPKIVFDGKTCPSCKRTKNLNGLYFATAYENFITKRFIRQFKYEPYVKDLATPLASLIIEHLTRVNALGKISDFSLISAPLHIKKMKQRGYNQSEELAKELSKNLVLPFLKDILLKIKPTRTQTELKKEERNKNIRNAFLCAKPDLIKNKNILLVDDVFTSGATMEECAKVLKNAGAKEVWGVAVARG